MRWILLLSLCSCGSEVLWDGFKDHLKLCDINGGVLRIGLKESVAARITCKNGASFRLQKLQREDLWQVQQ
jgi:hypothetical protein